MRLSRLIKTTLVCTLLAVTSNDYINGQTNDNFSYLKNNFFNPPSVYRTAPFMVWNGKVSAAEIDRTIKEFKDAGCGAVIIHPRPGLITEYLSDEWFILYHYAVLKAKAAGMKVWIYDENSYPSGFAGGHVPAEMPSSYNQGQGLKMKKVDRLPNNTSDYYLIIKREGNRCMDITNNITTYKGLRGDFYLYTKEYFPKTPWFGGYSNVDLLVNGVTQKFIDVTMDGYQKLMKNEFGKTILGVFSDEPSSCGPAGTSVRWTPDLFSAFKRKWGYDLKPLLPLLNEEIGNWIQVRHNYQQTILELFIDRWSKPSNKFYATNNLKWTGHYYEHYWPQMLFGPDNMAMYAWHQMPGVDMLFNQFNEENPQTNFGNVRAIKELRSVANQMGRERTLSETYGGGGWNETFKDFKRLGDWEYVLGVNFMNQHLAHMTIEGTRKYDYPPEFNYHSTWWLDYRMLNDYFGRLSMMLSKGTQRNNILIIEPTTTIWSYSSNTGDSPRLMEIGKSFQSFITTLEKHQVEYDLGSENIMRDHGSVVKNRLIIGKASYGVVVLPPNMENINKPTFDLLRQYVRQGGKLICFSTPTRISGGFNKEVEKIFDRSSVIHLAELTEDVMQKYFSTSGLKIDFHDGDLYHHRRVMRDGEVLFLVNSSMTEATTGSISINGRTLLKMDNQTGKIYSYPASTNGKQLEASFKIEPAGSLMLYALSNRAMTSYPVQTTEAGNKKLQASTPLTIKRLKGNALTIDYCDLTVKDSVYKDIHTFKASTIAYKAHGFEKGNPWSTSIQYKRNIVNRDTFLTGGFTVAYRFQIKEAFNYTGMRLVSEHPELFTVKVNGVKVTAIPGEWELDRAFGVYNIEKLVKQGTNTVEVSITPMSIYAEIEPIYIMGDFSVDPEAVGWSISSPVKSLQLGSWKDQRQPFYSWEMSYSKNYQLNFINGHYAVKLNKWIGTVSEVFVNGEKAGIIAFDPYKLDITPYLRKGENTIDVHVIGSLRNLIGPFYHKSEGIVEPHYFRNYGKPFAGKDYPMVDYGMIEDFDLLN